MMEQYAPLTLEVNRTRPAGERHNTRPDHCRARKLVVDGQTGRENTIGPLRAARQPVPGNVLLQSLRTAFTALLAQFGLE